MDTANTNEFPGYYRCEACNWNGSGFRATCPACGGEVYRAVTAGNGHVVDFVPVLYPPRNLNHLGAYTSVLVRFQEGFQMFGIYTGDTAKLAIGEAVEVESFENETNALFLKTP